MRFLCRGWQIDSVQQSCRFLYVIEGEDSIDRDSVTENFAVKELREFPIERPIRTALEVVR